MREINKLDKENCKIDWTKSVKEIHNQINFVSFMLIKFSFIPSF